jgi:biotin carboxylase
MIVSAASLPGVRVAVITHDSLASAPEWVRGAIAAHWQVSNILDADQLVAGANGVGSATGMKPQRLFGAYEQAQVPMAEAREKLGIPGMSPATAENFRDKARMKKILREHGVPCAKYALVTSGVDALAAADRIGYPLVVKPPSGAGAVSTHRVSSAAELHAVLAQNMPRPREPLLLEEFVAGEEHSLESITLGGSVLWHSLTHYSPTPLDTMRNPWIQWCVLLPRETNDARYDDIKEAGTRALGALGMTSGLSHMEWFRRSDGSVAIGEVGARPPGAQITTLVSRANDIDFLAEWARVMILDDFVVPVQRYAVGAAYLRGQGTGKVKTVRGLDSVAGELGSLICDYRLPTEGQSPIGSYEGEGFIIVRHPETAVVEKALARIISLVRVELG